MLTKLVFKTVIVNHIFI